MTGELKSMFETHLQEPNMNEIAEKQRVDIEQQQRKDYIKKQSNYIHHLTSSRNEKRIY